MLYYVCVQTCVMQAHSCFQKAVMIVGLQHWRKLPASGDNEFAVRPQQLAEAVAADLQAGLIPFYFLGTIGECWSCSCCCCWLWWWCSLFPRDTFCVGWTVAACAAAFACAASSSLCCPFPAVVFVQAPPAAVQLTPSLSWLTSACSESQLTVVGVCWWAAGVRHLHAMSAPLASLPER